MALTDKLTNIADAIRTKTETTDKMTLDEMPEKISKLDDTRKYFYTTINPTSLYDENTNKDWIKSLPDIEIDCSRLSAYQKVRILNYLFAKYSWLLKIPNVKLLNNNSTYLSMEYIFRNDNHLSDVTGMYEILEKYEINNLYGIFAGLTKLDENQIQGFVSKIRPATQLYDSNQSLNSAFSNISQLKSINIFDTTYYTNFTEMFNGDDNLKNINGVINFSNASNVDRMISYCYNLETISISNLGKTKLSSRTVDIGVKYTTKLTHESLVGLLEGLYDISQTDWTGYTFILSKTQLDSLSDEEKKIATDKGWVLSS